MNPYADAALVYWAAGWRGILPLPAGAKDPPPHGWTGADGAVPSYADVWAWREQHPSGNLALRLPDGLIGIDVDAYGTKQGGPSLRALVDTHGPLPATWRSTSREDGVSGISLFRVPDGLRWPGEAGAGIEIIQRRHRYVVAWPSIHPEGGKYQWVDDLQIPFEGAPGPDDFPWLPEPWVNGLTAGRLERDIPKLGSVDTLAVSAWLGVLADGDMCRATARALDRSRDFDPARSRHDGALRSAMHLARLAAEGHLGVPRALAGLGAAFTLAVTPERGESGALDEWRRIVEGAVSVVLADPMRGRPVTRDPCADPLAGICEPLAPGEVVLPLVPDIAPPELDDGAQGEDDGTRAMWDFEVGQEVHRQRVRREAKRRLDAEEAEAAWRRPVPMSLIEMLAQPDDPIRWTVTDVLPTGSNVLISAQFKAGKTTMINHLAACLADGMPFLGHFHTPMTTGRIALWNYEVSASMYIRWLRALGIANVDKIMGINLRGFNMPLTAPAVVEWIVQWLTENAITDWIIDPWARAITGVADENDNTEVGRVLDILDGIKERAGVQNLIVPTHTGRMLQEQGQERARGATRVDDWADVRWILTEQDGTRFFRAHGRDVDVDEGQLAYDPIMRSLTYGEGGREPVNASGGRPKLLPGELADEILIYLAGNPGQSRGDIVKGIRRREKAVREAVAILAQHGKIKEMPGHRLYTWDQAARLEDAE